MRVGLRQRLAGELGIRDEAPRARRAYYVSAPQSIDTENGVAYKLLEAVIHDFSSGI
jgi:hypothetical protein